MNGYIKMLASEFNAFEADALSRVQAVKSDPTMTAYSFATPDKDDESYIWARVEDGFYTLMTSEERDLVEEVGNFTR